MLNYLLVGALCFAAGWMVGRTWGSVKRVAGSVELAVMWDGRNLTVHKAVGKAGHIEVGKEVYTPAVYHRAHDVELLGYSVYLIAAEPIELADHRQLQSVLRSTVRGAMFKQAGDMEKTLRNAGSIAVICSALFVSWLANGVQGALVRQEASINLMSEALSRLMVMP